jgi:hypothetical protein
MNFEIIENEKEFMYRNPYIKRINKKFKTDINFPTIIVPVMIATNSIYFKIITKYVNSEIKWDKKTNVLTIITDTLEDTKFIWKLIDSVMRYPIRFTNKSLTLPEFIINYKLSDDIILSESRIQKYNIDYNVIVIQKKNKDKNELFIISDNKENIENIIYKLNLVYSLKNSYSYII